MILQRVGCISVIILCTASIAAGQSRPAPTDAQTVSKVVEYTYGDDVIPWRVVSTRSTTGGREVTVDTVESPNVDGRMAPIQETVTQKTRPSATSEQTTQEVFVIDANGRRRLWQTTGSQRNTLANGDTSTVHDTFRQDLDGRPALTSRTTEQLRTVAPGVRQAESTLLQPDPNEALHEARRTEETESRIDTRTIRYDSTELLRDLNGRWLAFEARNSETRETAAERLEEGTILRVDINGRLTPVEQTVSRGSTANGRDEVVNETYLPYIDRLPASGSGLALSERSTRTTTKRADGSSSTVEEVEGRNLVAPADPMRVVRRTVITTRPIGGDRWITEREVFERDVNGRMQRVVYDTQDSSGR